MGQEFRQVIPKKPIFKSNMYKIPENYLKNYRNISIREETRQKLLFYGTQFGGFRFKTLPNYIRDLDGFLLLWFKEKQENGFFQFKTNTKFISKLGNIPLEPLQRVWGHKEVLNFDEMMENGFSKDEIVYSINFLKELNKFYSDLRLKIPSINSGITYQDRIDLSRFHSIPFLVKKPKAGGRFFHPESSYQRISSSLREHMTINGEKTSEIDLSAATLQFMDISLKNHNIESPMNVILSNSDPYNYFLKILNSVKFRRTYNEKKIQREDLKKIVYTIIYASETRRKSSLNWNLSRMKINYRYFDLFHRFPEFFEAIELIESLKTDQQLIHHIIYGEESKYAQKVLEIGCLDKGIPLLPIHDSFVTPIRYADTLEKIMNDVAQELYGKTLLYKVKY